MASKRYELLGLENESDLLLWLPRDYRDLANVVSGGIAAADLGQKALLHVTFMGCKAYPIGAYTSGKGRVRLAIKLRDDEGVQFESSVIMADGCYPVRQWRNMRAGARITVQGKIKVEGHRLTMEYPSVIKNANFGRIDPVYRGRKGVAKGSEIGREIRKLIVKHAQAAASRIREVCGLNDRQLSYDTGYSTVEKWLEAVHCPGSMDEAKAALAAAKRVALHELTAHARRVQARDGELESVIELRSDHIEDIKGRFGHTLTGAQQRAIKEIVTYLGSIRPMRAILNADVSSGKTISFLAPLLAAARAGYKVAVMAPNLLLVEQNANEARRLAPDLDIQVVNAGGTARRGAALFGTHALISACKRAHLNLDFLVIDEQQKFSTSQRTALQCAHTNVLEVSATPIPRSMAMMLAGGQDVITLDECPVQRKIQTRLVNRDDRTRLEAHLAEVVKRGKLACVVYPRIGTDDDDEQEVHPKVQLAPMVTRWEQKFPGRLAVLHGDMEPEEKRLQMQRILSGQANILVATTLIEIGVTLPEMCWMLVVEADLFGMAQLHQLRGRLARKGGTGYFFMLSRSELTEVQRRRLEALVTHETGFDLAEAELELRGMGDMAGDGEQQSGASATVFPTIRVGPDLLRKTAKVLALEKTAA